MIRRSFDLLVIWLGFLIAAAPALAGFTLETVSDAAYDSNINGVSFQQDALVTYNGYQYAVYWSRDRHVAVARRALPTGSWESLELTDYQFQTADAHYDISLGISPDDGTLHLSFDQWSSEFRYRKSVPGLAHDPAGFDWQPTLFGPVQNHLTGAALTPTTYPRFVATPSGKLQLLLRHGISGAGDSHLYEYDGIQGRWTAIGLFVNGLASDVSPYFNGIHYDPSGRLHVTWVWRETPDAASNRDLHYAYSDDEGRTWLDNTGRQIATTGSQPISEATPGIKVWSIGRNRGLINQESQIIDGEGRVSVLLSHLPDEAPSQTDFRQARLGSHVFHYQRDAEGNWTRQELPGSSFSYDRNKLAVDAQGNLFAVVNRDGIYRADASDGWRQWRLLQTLADQALFGEVQIDRQRLLDDGTLSFINPATPGRMLVFNLAGASQLPVADASGGGPVGYRLCALEGDICQVDGERDVAFGAGGRFSHRVASGQVPCDTATFGEPVRGSVKRCYYSTSPPTTATAPTGYQPCAAEQEICQVPGSAQVAFGAAGRYHYRIVADAVACTNTEFGDPINGTEKNCYWSPWLTASGESSSSSSSSSSTSNSSSSGTGSSGSTTGGVAPGSLLPLLLVLTLSRGNRQRRSAAIAGG